MSAFHPDKLTFRIEDEELHSSYDEQADILYLWRGEPREAVSLTSEEGHLIRFNPDTGEIVGFTIFDFKRRWCADELPGQFYVSVPDVESDAVGLIQAQRVELLTA
jgi:uncharacterized protein YuzE